MKSIELFRQMIITCQAWPGLSCRALSSRANSAAFVTPGLFSLPSSLSASTDHTLAAPIHAHPAIHQSQSFAGLKFNKLNWLPSLAPEGPSIEARAMLDFDSQIDLVPWRMGAKHASEQTAPAR